MFLCTIAVKDMTTDNIAKTGAFTVSMATEDYVAACDYVGIESANNVPDKFEKVGNAFSDGLKLKHR